MRVGSISSFGEWLTTVGYNLSETLQGQLESGSPMALGVVFLAGVVTSFTPCVYPMIPVTVTFIGGASGGSRRRAVSLSVVYVLGLALIYAALGVVAALIGAQFGDLSQNAWVNLVVGALIVCFGLFMLDLWTIRVPLVFGQVQSEGARRGGHLGALLMGMASGFIAAPCTAPVLAILLLFVGQQRNVVWGGTLLLTFALGLGFLLMLLGIFSGMLSSLPRAGSWMDWIKRGFGVAMIGVGLFFLWKALAGFIF